MAGNWSQFSVFISQCFDWRQIQFRPIRAGGNNYQVCLCLLRFGRRKWREPQNAVEELALQKQRKRGQRAAEQTEPESISRDSGEDFCLLLPFLLID